MPNRRLTKPELEWAGTLVKEVLDRLRERSGDDSDLLFALRRKVFKELTYAERDRPGVRTKLKIATRTLQNGLCAECGEPLPKSYAVLDRLDAAKGYVPGNVRVLCEPCDRRVQVARRYNDESSN
jgi:RNase P subunit RPR2